MWISDNSKAPERVSNKKDIDNEIDKAVIEFNLNHTYQASIVFLPKQKYDLITSTMQIYHSSLNGDLNVGYKNQGIKVQQHPLETIKEIIVI